MILYTPELRILVSVLTMASNPSNQEAKIKALIRALGQFASCLEESKISLPGKAAYYRRVVLGSSALSPQDQAYYYEAIIGPPKVFYNEVSNQVEYLTQSFELGSYINFPSSGTACISLMSSLEARVEEKEQEMITVWEEVWHKLALSSTARQYFTLDFFQESMKKPLQTMEDLRLEIILLSLDL